MNVNLYFVATCKRPFGPLLLNKMNECLADLVTNLRIVCVSVVKTSTWPDLPHDELINIAATRAAT